MRQRSSSGQSLLESLLSSPRSPEISSLAQVSLKLVILLQASDSWNVKITKLPHQPRLQIRFWRNRSFQLGKAPLRHSMKRATEMAQWRSACLAGMCEASVDPHPTPTHLHTTNKGKGCRRWTAGEATCGSPAVTVSKANTRMEQGSSLHLG